MAWVLGARRKERGTKQRASLEHSGPRLEAWAQV